MGPALYIVDAFTGRGLPQGGAAGNPAAVCLLEGPADDAWMQELAAELNQAETAFLCPEGDGHRLRWFTPTQEVDLCGHATLAAAHVLWETGQVLSSEAIRFLTRSGPLTAVRDGGQPPDVLMDFPSLPPRPNTPPEGLFEALGLSRVATRACL